MYNTMQGGGFGGGYQTTMQGAPTTMYSNNMGGGMGGGMGGMGGGNDQRFLSLFLVSLSFFLLDLSIDYRKSTTKQVKCQTPNIRLKQHTIEI